MSPTRPFRPEPSAAASSDASGRPLRALIAHPGAELYGSDRVMLETVSGLTDAGWEVTVTVPDGGPLLDEVRRRGGAGVILPVPVLRRSLLRPAGLVRLAREAVPSLRRCILLIRSARPDLLYVSTVTLPIWLIAARLARIPVVSHVHEAERAAPRPLRTGLALPLLLARRIVVNSRYTLDTLRSDLPALTRRTAVVYNGVAGPERETPPRPALEGRLRIAYVGRLSERKGVHVAVEALALLRRSGIDARLDLVGAVFPGYEDYQRRLEERVAALELTGSVRFLGFRHSVWDALADADVAVVPSIGDESFGNAAIEAVLAARPVVVSSRGALPEAVAPFASAHVARAGDADELAAALRSIVDDWDALRPQAIEDARAAASRYSPAAYRATVAELFREVSHRRRLGRLVPEALSAELTAPAEGLST